MKRKRLIGLSMAYFVLSLSWLCDFSTANASTVEVLFNNYNTLSVNIGNPPNPTVFALNDSYIITYISTYHYINPGTLENPGGTPDSQVGSIGLDLWYEGEWKSIGVWSATGTDSHWPDGRYVENANWFAYPNIDVMPGSYRMYDSVPESWSHNSTSGQRGFASVEGAPVPVPATMLLFGSGLVGLFGARIRRMKKRIKGDRII